MDPASGRWAVVGVVSWRLAGGGGCDSHTYSVFTRYCTALHCTVLYCTVLYIGITSCLLICFEDIDHLHLSGDGQKVGAGDRAFAKFLQSLL